jgi:hypothetical protein
MGKQAAGSLARIVSLAGALIVFLLTGSGMAIAETRYALLVGVNQYRNLPAKNSLVGPANDAASLLDYLTGTAELGFQRENIVLLANGPIAADGEPDGHTILEAMARLAGDVKPGDFVYLHFGGHGSRQAARNPATEPDGLDEIFLPADTGPQQDGLYPNALVDDDIGAAVDKIRAAGAFVFAVFDSCHSSSATRAPLQQSSEITERWLPDATYETTQPPGVQDLRQASIDPAEHSLALPGNAGGLVTFFAAQTVETTPEMPLPRGVPGAPKHGLFTYTLLDVLAKRPGITYRQLAEGIMHGYSVGNFTRPTPLFEGDLDRVVFGQQARPPVLQWPLEVSGSKAVLPAGALHGLTRDTILALMADPLADTSHAIGYLRIASAATMSSSAVPIAHDGLPAPSLSSMPAGVRARPVEIPLSFELSVELPGSVDERFAEAGTQARQAITGLAADESLPMNLRVVEEGGVADLRLVVGSEAAFYPGENADDTPRLWFLPPDGKMPSDRRMMPHSIGLSAGLSEAGLAQLKENLAAVFRATSLSRLSMLSTLDSSEIRVGFSLHRQGAADSKALETSAVPVAAPGDEIHIGVENNSAKPVDIDVLLIGPSYSIQHMMGQRFQPKDRLETPIIGIGPSNFGLRRVLLVMREAKRNSPHTDLSFLEQIGVQTRGPAPQGARDFDQLLGDIGTAPATRASLPYKAKSELKGALRIFSVESVPPG